MKLRHEHAVMAEQCTGRGRNGVVSAAAPLAALAGAEALRAGGNAFDAAVTAALCETVLLPPKCGLGGDLIAICRPAGEHQPLALLAIGGAAHGLAEVAAAGAWRDVGPASVGPPAAAAGYEALADRGVLGRAALAAPAVDLARGGFPWAPVCTRLAEQARGLVEEMNPHGTVYFPGGQPIAPGTLTRLPGLADALDEWVARGAALLNGPFGVAIVAAVQGRGGVLSIDDLQFANAEWTECSTVMIDAAGRRAWATPPPTHGAALLSALTDARPDDGPATVLRRVTDAISRRDAQLADPGGTSMVSAADAEGNAVTIVHSNSYPRFGSGIIVDGYDIVLANRAGRGFTPEIGHPNFPVPGRRPATTLHAWALSDESGAVRFLGGTPGGDNQLPWNAQVIQRLLAGQDEPGVVVTAPLWERLPNGGLRVEGGFEPNEHDEIAATVGPDLRTAPRWGCKSAIQVTRLAQPGEAWVAAADPRTQGAAIGI